MCEDCEEEAAVDHCDRCDQDLCLDCMMNHEEGSCE